MPSAMPMPNMPVMTILRLLSRPEWFTISTRWASTAMGIPGQFDRPEFQEALRRVQAVCAAAGKPSILYAADEAAARAGFAMGYGSITYGMDASTLVKAYQAARKNILG